MPTLTPHGRQAIQSLAERHGFSTDAVTTMLDAVSRGNASMAQFNHPEFGGSGQWMSGGMTMLSDMFNHNLKGRVDNLCADLANLVMNQPNPLYDTADSLFAPAGPDWWGADLRWPNSTGSQNGVRYAYFAQARRLAIEINGEVTVYDTLDHQLGGFSQQQSGDATFSFQSQYGLVNVASLPVVSVNGMAPVAAPLWAPAPVASSPQGDRADTLATLERLAALHGQGVLTDAEFQGKKAELLARL